MDNNSQYLQMFFDESAEYIQMLNENILVLEQEPNNKEIINSVFRAAHSLKGMAATMGFDKLTDLTHKIENVLDKVRNDELVINEEMIDYLFAGFDLITTLVEDIKTKGEEASDISNYVEELKTYLAGDHTAEKEEVITKLDENFMIDLDNNEKNEIVNKMKETDYVYQVNTVLNEDSMLKSVRGYMVIKKATELGHVVKSKPSKEKIEDEDFGNEISLILVTSMDENAIIDEIEDIIDVQLVIIKQIEMVKSTKEKDNKSNSPENSSSKSNSKVKSFDVAPTVRVDINKLDNLMNMVGELLINKTRLEGLKVKSDIYQDILQQLDRVTMELHHVVMQIRMVPIGGIFNRFPRMLRDLSKELNKQIDLIIEGADTELDRSIIDELADPLVHILRNAADHGIESPEARQKKDKDAIGKILLSAYQKGSEIIIEVEDDGGGIDPDLMAEIAIEKGIATPEEIQSMEKKEKLNFIFHPGFSTSKEVTDVSGRGVGMDVVKRVVESLDGQVFIESEMDVGTRFTISLPLTLAITQALMVKIDEEVFAIPLSAISETLTVNPQNIRQVSGQDVIVLRESTIPIIEASKQLNLDVSYRDYINDLEIPIVIVNTGDKQVGLIVDELMNQQEIVIKSLGNYLIDAEHISGATIIGDGNVALILDVRNIA